MGACRVLRIDAARAGGQSSDPGQGAYRLFAEITRRKGRNDDFAPIAATSRTFLPGVTSAGPEAI